MARRRRRPRGADTAPGDRQAGQNQGVQGYSPPPPALECRSGISRDQIQTMGRETPAALLMG